MLREKITQNEKQMINILREEILDESSGAFVTHHLIDCDSWLKFWEKSKDTCLAEPFSESLILRKPITVFMEDEELHQKMYRYISDIECQNFFDCFMKKIAEYNICDHSYDGRWFNLKDVFYGYLFNVDAFIKNIYDFETIEILLPDHSRYKIVKGVKVMRTIGKIAKAYGIDDQFENIRLKQSQILNDAKITSTLCLSIHPLDYMTASYNSNHWRSCMCWDRGEYRRGVIEMMNSEFVVVAYLESKHENLPIGRFNWNSKKWREFFIVTPDLISGIKGYPYWNREVEDIVLKWLYELYAPVFAKQNINFDESIRTFRVGNGFDFGKFNIIGLNIDMDCGPGMYNDFYDSNDYHFLISDHQANSFKKTVYINYSGESECVACGRDDTGYDTEGDLLCCGCIEHHYCCSCGENIYDEYDLHYVDGDEYCESCYENLDRCSLCDDIINPNFDENYLKFGTFIRTSEEDKPNRINAVATQYPNDDWLEIDTVIVCEGCASDVFIDGYEEMAKSHPYLSMGWSYYQMVPWDKLTEQGRELFDKKLVKEAKKRVQKDGYIEPAKVKNFFNKELIIDF